MKHEHIDEYCRKLAAVWKRVPSWRFGQLITNLTDEYEAETGNSIFYPEDKELFDFFRKCVSIKEKE